MAMDRMILGQDAVYSTDSNVTCLNNNVLVCGSSGCGKTMSISEPLFIETHSSSLIATVTKRRIVDKYIDIFKDRGYDVEILDFINPAQSTVAYDPIRFVDSYSAIQFLAEQVVLMDAKKKNDSNHADPYWDIAAASLLSAEIAYSLMVKENPTFTDVLELHDGIKFEEHKGQISTSLDQQFEYLEKKNPGCYAVSCWNSFKHLPIKTASCVFSSLNVTIDKVFSPELREMMSKKDTIDFERIAAQKTVVFVLTSAVNPALHSFANMFYGQAFKNLFEYAESLPDGKLPVPVRMLCDDFATGGRILNFPDYISIFREKLISVTLLLQSESQLESMYGSEDATTIINNCDSYCYMGGMDLKTAKNISERLNVPLDEVLYMPVGKTVIFRRGQKPVVTERYDILQNETYKNATASYERKIKGKSR